MTTQRFHLGAVLSITTGRLLCQMDDVYKIAQHLAGEPVWTHQLPRVGREAKPHLLAQFPALAAVTGDGVTPENFAAWLYERISEHGEWFDVAPLTWNRSAPPLRAPLQRSVGRLPPGAKGTDMGCDIHSHAEKQDSGRWVSLDVEAFDGRDYGFFGWLAGVRNYSGLTPIAAGRGLPSDASRKAAKDYDAWRGDAHSASWVSVAELAAVDYEQTIEDRRCTKQLGPNLWTGGGTCEPGEGKKETLREFLGPGFFAVLKRLQDAGADRVVFWFDN